MSVPVRDRKFDPKALVFHISIMKTRIYLDIYAAIESAITGFGKSKEYSAIFNEQSCKNALNCLYSDFQNLTQNIFIASQITLNPTCPLEMYKILFQTLNEYLSNAISCINMMHNNIDFITSINRKIYTRINHYNLKELEDFKKEILNWKHKINKKSKSYFENHACI